MLVYMISVFSILYNLKLEKTDKVGVLPLQVIQQEEERDQIGFRQ